MSVRNPGRYMAPVAIVVVLIAVLLIVRARTGGQSTAAPHISHPVPLLSRETPSVHRAKVYIVKPGDTLSVISVKTHVPVARLEALNPSLANPDTLQTGQRLRLR